MRLSCTFLEILSLIFQKLNVTVTTPLQRELVVHRLGIAMFDPRIKYEVYTITCNKDMIGNTKCKNSHFEPLFGDLGVTYMVHLWLVGKRMVNFLLVLNELLCQLLRLKCYEWMLA